VILKIFKEVPEFGKIYKPTHLRSLASLAVGRTWLWAL
jgi:hypothetical protein